MGSRGDVCMLERFQVAAILDLADYFPWLLVLIDLELGDFLIVRQRLDSQSSFQ